MVTPANALAFNPIVLEWPTIPRVILARAIEPRWFNFAELHRSDYPHRWLQMELWCAEKINGAFEQADALISSRPDTAPPN